MEEKKRVGIISLFHENINYGGVLQAYALRKVIADMGYECEQIRYSTKTNTSLLSRVTKYYTSSLKNTVNTISIGRCIIHTIKFPIILSVKLFQLRFISKYRLIRREKFIEFNEKYIPSSDICTNETIAKISLKYDIFVTGSDQVWNPNHFSSVYYLTFVPDDKNKISYAASVSAPKLTAEQHNRIKPLINRFQHLSVREEDAIAMLQSMNGTKIEWVLDPTLLLTVSNWEDISHVEIEKEPYIFAYILGENKIVLEKISIFSKEEGVKLVTFPFTNSTNLHQLKFGDVHSYGGPDEWLALIRDAKYVITDSFHAVVFSLLFHKKFIVLRRNSDDSDVSMNSRFYSLAKLLPDIEDRIVDISNINHVYDGMNWERIDSILSEKRQQSIEWLKHALKTK